MTTGEKWFTGISAGIIGALLIYFIGVTQGWWKNIFASAPSHAPTKTDFEKCTEANKSKADGTSCSNCVPEGSGQPNYNGIIRNGECVPKRESVSEPMLKRYVVSNKNGATVYSLQGNNFVAPRVPNKVPFKTLVTILAISPDQQYVNTAYGWLSISDISE